MENNVLDAKDFIAAIRTVRTLGSNRYNVSGFNGGERIVLEPLASIGLKEAKEFIEGVMAIGVQRYLDDQVLAQARERARRQPASPDDIRF